MKIKEGFILRKVGTDHVVVAVGEASKAFHGMIKLNETAAFIWQLVEQGLELDEITDKMTETYDVDAETARRCAADFIAQMEENGVLQGTNRC